MGFSGFWEERPRFRKPLEEKFHENPNIYPKNIPRDCVYPKKIWGWSPKKAPGRGGGIGTIPWEAGMEFWNFGNPRKSRARINPNFGVKKFHKKAPGNSEKKKKIPKPQTRAGISEGTSGFFPGFFFKEIFPEFLPKFSRQRRGGKREKPGKKKTENWGGWERRIEEIPEFFQEK